MNESTISEKVTAVIADGLSYCRETRQCQSFDDFNFLSTGLTRVIECHSSGREFLQTIKEDPSESEGEILLQNVKLSPIKNFALNSRARALIISKSLRTWMATTSSHMTGIFINTLAMHKEIAMVSDEPSVASMA